MSQGIEKSVEAVQQVSVSTWTELEKHIPFDWWGDSIEPSRGPTLNRYRTRHLYRGLVNARYELTTPLQRVIGAYPSPEWDTRIKLLEPLMLRQFKKYAQVQVGACTTDWHWLSLAQHHLLPTRLLDWTNSPLVALHFATSDRAYVHTDAALWAVDFIAIQKDLPKKLQQRLEKLHVKAFTVTELGEEAPRLEDLEQMPDELEKRGEDPAANACTQTGLRNEADKGQGCERAGKKDFMLFFEPPSIDDRIANQYAAFSVMRRATSVPEKWLRDRPYRVAKKIVIRARLKPDIRDFLDAMNMTERVFFPGPDGLNTWLQRYYGPSPREERLGSQTLYCGQHLDFRRTFGGWEYVSRANSSGGVVIVPVTRNGDLVFVEQLRPPLGKQVVEFPAGLVSGEDPGSAARRELEEETGCVCDSVKPLGSGASCPGLTDEQNSFWLALGVSPEGDSGASDPGDYGSNRYRRARGVQSEGEEVFVWTVPVNNVLPWLKQREGDGRIVDLRVYTGLFLREHAAELGTR